MTTRTLYDFCCETDRFELLSQWDKLANGELTPRQVSPGSHKMVWWRDDCGHSWQARIYARTYGQTGCPYCSGRLHAAEVNSLSVTYPALTHEWHPTKNGALSPEALAPGSHRKVWWRCAAGHEWTAEVKSRAAGSGCPVCHNRKILPGVNDLATLYPALVPEWHPEKNGALTPDIVSAGSRRKVYWRCPRGHEWQAAIVSRTTGGTGCPVCDGKQVIPGENDLLTAYPDLAREWHPAKNGSTLPIHVSPYSNRSVWWRCALGHEWQAPVASRTSRGSGCPYCTGRRVLPGFNDLATTDPAVAAQWHPTRNGALTPAMVTRGSRKYAWWQCEAGHEWRAVIYSRTADRPSGCPQCAGRRTPAKSARYAAILADANPAEADRDF